MNKRVVAAVIALVVVIGGAVGALALNRALVPVEPEAIAEATPEPTLDLTESTPTPEPTTEPDAVVVVPGTYISWNETAIAEAPGKVVLFFHAPWCGQCLKLEDGILAQGVPDGVTIIKVDWDTRQDLEQKYDVPQRTTFVELDADGGVVQRYTAYSDPRFELVVEAMNL